MSSIPSQLPQFVTAARSAALQALALQAGQVLDAKILGAAPNGGTQVEIRGQLLNLVLPTAVQAGDTIKLEVQGSGQQLRLVLQLPAATVSPSPPQPAPAAPQVSVPLPGAETQPPPPLANSAPAQGAPVAGSVVSAANAVAPAAPPAGQVQGQPIPAAGSASAAPTSAPGVSPQATTATAPGSVPAAAPGPAVATAAVAQPVSGMSVAAGTGVQVAPTTAYPAGLPNPAAVAAAGTVATKPAPSAPVAVQGAVRPVGTATTLSNATAHQAPGNPAPQSQAAPAATTPQAALAQMVHAAVPRQGSITGLTMALASIAGKVVLPEPVARAAQQVLAGRVSIDKPSFDGNALQAAVRGSGVFQEAGLAKGQSQLLQSDMKTALLTLRQTLTSWLGQQAPVAAVAPLPPPLRGMTPRARAVNPPAIDTGAAPEEVGKQLLERTESALARVRLHQHASLPDPTGRSADLSLDLPVMVGTQQTLMQFQIHRDQHSDTEASGERGWQMKFAISLPGMGEVGAQVSFRAGAVGVMLWATEPDASAALDVEIAELREALTAAGLSAGSVVVRHGEPPAPAPAPSGHFVDSRT